MEKSTFSVSYFLRKNKKYRNGSAPLLVRITYNGVSGITNLAGTQS